MLEAFCRCLTQKTQPTIFFLPDQHPANLACLETTECCIEIEPVCGFIYFLVSIHLSAFVCICRYVCKSIGYLLSLIDSSALQNHCLSLELQSTFFFYQINRVSVREFLTTFF